MNYQGIAPDSQQQQFSSATRQSQRGSVQQKNNRTIKAQNSSSSPTAIQRKNMYQAAQQQQMQLQLQTQQFNLPAVNQSRSERSLENSSGYGANLNLNHGQKYNMGSLTSRNEPQTTLSQIQLLQNQQMIPSNYTNNQNQVISIANMPKQAQNEKLKSYSRKLQKIVSSSVSGGGGSASNSRTPNAKKKVKQTSLGLTQSISNAQGMMKTIRSGLSTSRGGPSGITPSMLTTSQIYGNGQQILNSARANLQIQTNQSRVQTNTTFDIDEHYKNVIKSVERRNRQNPYNQSSIQNQMIASMQGGGMSSSYLQTNMTQLMGNNQLLNQIQNIGGVTSSNYVHNSGSVTSRNLQPSQFSEYSPEQAQSLSKSPTNRAASVLNPAVFSGQIPAPSNKSTIFSNFSNNTYFIGQKKNSQQSHSLGKKSSYQGNIALGNQSTIMLQQKVGVTPSGNQNNVSGSISRKRGSSKKDAIIMLSKQIIPLSQQRQLQQQQESEIFSATQRSLKGYDDAISIRKKRASLGIANQNQVIPSHAAIHYVTKKQISGLSGAQTSRIANQSYNRNSNQSYVQGITNSATKKKQQNWFSPPSSSHVNMSSSSNVLQQNVLSTIDNNSSQAVIDRTQGTSQFVSPRSFLNKSGAGMSNHTNYIASNQVAQTSMGDKNPLLLTSIDTIDENQIGGRQQLTINQIKQLQQQKQAFNPLSSYQGDWSKIQKLAQLRFFQNCTLIKFFRRWGTKTRASYFKNRKSLSDNLLYAKSKTFGEYFRQIMAQINIIKSINILEENLSIQKPGSTEKFNDCCTIIKNSLKNLQTYIIKSNNEYEKKIRESGSLGRKTSDASKNQNLKKLEAEHLKVMQQRCNNFDRFLQMVMYALSSAICEMLHVNKTYSTNKIKVQCKFNSASSNLNPDDKQILQSQYSTYQEHYLSTYPSLKNIKDQILKSQNESQSLVFNNRKLIENLTKIFGLFLNKPSGSWDVNSFYQRIESMIKIKSSSSKPTDSSELIKSIESDVDETERLIHRLDELKQILQFDERWSNQQSNQTSQNGWATEAFVADIESSKETQILMEKFQEQIKSIPSQPLVLRHFIIDFSSLREQLSKVPQKVIQQINRKVASSLETDTLSLMQDLNKTYQILEQTPSTLNVYVEQVNTLTYIKKTIGELNNRHDSIKRVSLMCQTGSIINIKESVSSSVKELQQLIENLPTLIRHCEEKLNLSKPQMELQMKQSCQGLTTKIKAFEKKYCERYLKVEDPQKFKDENLTQQTISELKYRQKMIDEMRQKAKLYQECLDIMNLSELQKSKELTCFSDCDDLEILHDYTLRVWSILDEWRGLRGQIIQKPFLKLNFSEIIDFIDRSLSFIEQKLQEDQSIFKHNLLQLSSLIKEEMSELQLSISLVKDLRKDCIKKKHWSMIFNELGLQSLLNRVEEFTLLELFQKGNKHIYSFNPEIRDILRLAEIEQEFEDQYLLIKTQVNETLKFKFVEYRSPINEEVMYLISEFDIVQSQLEEFIVILKKGQKSQNLTEVTMKDNFIKLFTQIENMQNVLEKINDAQKMILTLDGIFSQIKIQQTLTLDFKNFLEIKKYFRNNITGKLYSNPSMTTFQTYLNLIIENLDKIQSSGTLIQKSIEDYLEAKRLAFPRFFFMTDRQFLEFVELAEQNLDFSRYINLLFPGVSKIFLDQPLQSPSLHPPQSLFKVPPPMINDLSQVKSEMIDVSQNLMAQQMLIQQQQIQKSGQGLKQGQPSKSGMINQKNQIITKPVIELDNLDKIESQYNSKRAFNSQTGPAPSQVLGLISTMNELFLFEKKVTYQQNKVECWLQNAETNMQDTIGKLINYAVNTFPKQSLDEWILDYPQQVILTTIHLILTHEINELFEELRKEKENGGESASDAINHGNRAYGRGINQGQDDSDEDYSGVTPKTPDTRDLIKNSQISHRTISQHVSQKSSVRYLRNQAGAGEAQMANQNMISGKRVSTHEFNSKAKSGSHSNYSTNQQKIKNQQYMKNSSQFYSEEGGFVLNQQHYGQGEDDEFTESELEALDMSRERKKFASNMFGSDFDLNLVADSKDDTMRILQEKSFRGLYLRLQFWINQICKSLYMSKSCNQSWKSAFEKDVNNLNSPEAPNLHLDLHPVQRLVMQTIINFLSYMRDVVYELKTKKIDNVEDFDWQKQMRLTWNGKDSGCKVDCGAWTTQQANEYFGAQQRVPLTPLTNKYFVFISAAFREKSAVLFRTVPSHDFCGDIFKEFSSICSVPFKEYQCNPKLSMKSLMQFLNGAALASVWIFFEHVDKLDYVHLQTFNKEIQMVQQQFIIAELSQDSSVITAHITVGNQSISQCQRSIERIREQASLESKQLTKGEQSIKNGQQSAAKNRQNQYNQGANKINPGADIKIEDNIEDNNMNFEDGMGSPSGFEDGEEDQSFERIKRRQGYNQSQYDDQINILQQDKLIRQHSKEELQYKSNRNLHNNQIFSNDQGGDILQNLSQIDMDNDGYDNHNQLEEDCEEIKLDECNNNSVGNGGNSKLNQNKVCFGVFASVSHAFNLRKEKWATEVSTALQSAFRVLSLTRPEMPIITSMLLKSEGFREYKEMSIKINDALFRTQDLLQLNDRDDSFAITVRDLKRLTKCASILLEAEIQNMSEIQEKELKRIAKRSKLTTYSMEKKSKNVILKEIEDEEQRERYQKQIRSRMEETILCHVLSLFLIEKLNSYYKNLQISDEKVRQEISEVIQQSFGKETIQKAKKQYIGQSIFSKESSQQLQKVLNGKGLNLLQASEIQKLKSLSFSVKQAKPVCVIGRNLTGKSLYINTILKDLHKLKVLHFDPIVAGSYRELYGVYDPISTTQQVIEQQIGQVKHSIFQILRNETSKQDVALVLDCDKFDIVFNEALQPYLEYQTFKEQNNAEAFQGQSLTLMLPNGIQETLKKNIPIIYEMKSLENVSPRFVSSVQVINTRDAIDLKELSNRIKTKAIQKLQSKVKISQKQLDESIGYSINEIIIPALNELRKAKYLDQANIKIAQALQWCGRTLLSILNDLKMIISVDQSLIKISLMTIFMTVGSLINSNGKKALEEIFSGLKSQIGVRGSLFNHSIDYDSLEIIELRSQMSNEYVMNPILLRATNYAQLLLRNRKNVIISGPAGSQRSTTIKLIINQQDFASKVTKLPTTCFATHKTLRHLLSLKSSNPTQLNSREKPTLFIIEDINQIPDNFNFNIISYMNQVKKNDFSIYHPQFSNLVQLEQSYVTLMSQTSQNLQPHLQRVQNRCSTIINNDDSEEFEGFVKSFISRKVMIAPSYQNQLSNILFETYSFVKQNSLTLNVSSGIKLSSLHLMNNLIQRINQSPMKDQNLVEALFVEVQRAITDRIIYPNLKQQVYEKVRQIVAVQLPTANFSLSTSQIDSLVNIQNNQNFITNIQEAKEIYPDVEQPILKQICSVHQNIKRPHSHYLYLTQAGSDLIRGFERLSEKLKYKLLIPSVQKFRDSYSFIAQINTYLQQSLKNSQKQIIIIQDSQLNDLSYVDYILNIIKSLRESTLNGSLSFFYSLDTLIDKNLRVMLIECARDIHNQQISHSPHSGISSPASPSSLTASINDSQLLMSSLQRLSTNVHFVFVIQNLQNYQLYSSAFSNLETFFQIAFIPQMIQPDNSSVIDEVSLMVSEYSQRTVYQEQYLSLLAQTEATFNNEKNLFYIPEHKKQNIFEDAIFEDCNYYLVSSELNLSIPQQFSQSKQRKEVFQELYKTIKQSLHQLLSAQKQYFQQYFEHYEVLQQDFMKKILTKDQSQVGKHHVTIFNLINIQEKIDLLSHQYKLKDQLKKQKDKERSDLSQNLDRLKDETQVNKNSSEGQALSYILRLKQIQSNEYKTIAQMAASGSLTEQDQEIIQALNNTLQSKKNISSYLQQPQELIQRLQQITTQQSVSETIILRNQKIVTKRLQSNQDKGLVTTIAKILYEIYKKVDQDRKYQSQDSNIRQLQEQLSFLQSSIQLYNQQMIDIKEEIEDLQIKEKNLKADTKDIIRRIDMKDIKNLRNDYKLKQLLKQGKKSEQKLDKVKIRIKNLEGDALILACSVAYLGSLSVSERMQFRKKLSEKLLTGRNIESSEFWQNTTSEQIHCKYFKKIIQNDLGLKTQIFNKLSHLFVDSLFCEFLFSYIFAPTVPIIYDAVGIYQQELTEQIFDEINSFKVKVLFSSDYMIQEKLQNQLDLALTTSGQGDNQLIYVHDLCDFTKQIQGKSQDQPLLQRLAEQQYFKRVKNVFKDNFNLSIPVVSLFSASSHYSMNQSYLANATIINTTFVNKNEAWIEIKQILLKHFLPDNYQKLSMIKQQTQMLRLKMLERQKAFDQLFLKIKRTSVEEKDHKQLEEVRLCYIDIKQLDEDYQQYNQAFHNLINEHPLLASYSNIFVILYFALKELSKFTEEVTYSWKIYTKVIDMIIAKIIRDLTMNLKNKDNEESDGEDDQNGEDGQGRRKKKDKEFTIDEEFFHSVIMPSIYSTIVAGVKQEHVSLFNLIFALEIALKKTTVSQEDKDFFVSRFFKIKNCYDWRINPHKPSGIPTGFVENLNQRIKLKEYMAIKMDILKIYPDLRQLFETIEIKVGKEFTYREANNLIYQKLFKGNSDQSKSDSYAKWKDLPLIKKLNVGFLCPDEEWRSKICQFVYEELTTIFDFTEDLNKLHNFIKTASWSLPIALFTSNSINIVNTVCSIASYYGVGLEVLRTDYQLSIKKHPSYYENKEINDNLKSAQLAQDPEKPLSNEAACIHYEQIDATKEDRVTLQKHNYQRMFSKDELEIDDKQITQNQSSIQLIEKCAENGTWVLISTLKFPSFWYKISRKLEKMAKKGKVLNTFRLFFDLQGYSLQEIPESFLFNHTVKFYLTEKNNEDMEGFNDVWANILNDDLLNAKDLHNVPILEPPSDMVKINLNLESNLYESSVDSLLPGNIHQNNFSKDQMHPNGNNKNRKAVKDDKITYSMSQYQSKDTIQLPQIFTPDHMNDILTGGNDLRSPRDSNGRVLGKIPNRLHKQNLEDEISEISIHNHFMMNSGLISPGVGNSMLLMDDMSRVEGAFLSELNQAFARKMSSVRTNDHEEEKQNNHHQQNQQRYEMVKKPAPNQKRQHPQQKN